MLIAYYLWRSDVITQRQTKIQSLSYYLVRELRYSIRECTLPRKERQAPSFILVVRFPHQLLLQQV